MNKYVTSAFFFLTLFLVFFSNPKIGTLRNSRIEKHRLEYYFKHIQTNGLRGTVISQQQFILDSLSYIKENTANIEFVEVSEFTDSLSLRWITSNANSYSNFVKLNSKKSTHIGTTYISVPQNYKFVNNDLKKVISVIESSLVSKTYLKAKDIIGDYLANNIKNCNLFCISGGGNVNTISSNLGNSKYQFDSEPTNNDSLFIAQFLINNYGFENFNKLWKVGFSRFEEIYGVSFRKLIQERQKLALLASKKTSHVIWEEFNSCM